MPPAKSHASRPWYLIPLRILLLTFLLTLLSFAVTLLLGILGVVIAARLQGVHPNMPIAYRYIAFPFAMAVAAVTLISATVIEIRRYRQTKALAQIERLSQPM